MSYGTVYGVILNDRSECAELGNALSAEPYGRPPVSAPLYIKPRGCLVASGGTVRLSPGESVSIAATVGLLFARATSRVAVGHALAGIGGACLALDVFESHASYYRPAIRERCRDGFLPLGGMGRFAPALASATVETRVDGELVHSWSLTRLARPMAALIAEVADYMTFEAGDLLLVGLPGDPPAIGAGQSAEVRAEGLPSLQARFVAELAT